MLRFRVAGCFLFLLGSAVFALPSVALAQSGVGVEIDQVVDDRFSGGLQNGSLTLQVKLTGSDLDRVNAARIVIKEARDDRGTNLATDAKAPDFRERNVNGGALEITLKSPPRTAHSARVKGSVELFVPGRDPNAVIKVEKALAKLDAPLSSKALRNAKISLTVLSPEGYGKEKEKQKITEKDIEQIRAEGKAHGASDKEIELAVGLAGALNEMGNEPLPPGAVVLSGATKDFERFQRVDLLGADGKPVDTPSRTSSRKGESTLMVIQPSEPLPPDTTLQLTLLTDKSRMSVPFELKNVVLP